MRVLHVYSGNLYGGIEALLLALARHRWTCSELEPEFALCFEGRLSEELRAAGVPVHLFDRVRASRPITVLRARRRLRELLNVHRFDVVICHAAWSQAIFAATVHAAGVPQVFWLHDAARGQHWLERWAQLSPPILAICNSRFTGGTLNSLYGGILSEVIYCPVPSHPLEVVSSREAIRSRLQTPGDATVIIQASRMEPWKGHELHLKALARLRDVPGWMSWQVGGAQRPHEAGYVRGLRRLAAELGIADRIRFLGQQTNVGELLGAADLYCQPNTGPEPFGIAFVEALLAGLPVVTTSIGAAVEIVDETCGVLVAPGDVEALSCGLRRLLTDPGLRRGLGLRGPHRARALSDPATQLRTLRSTLERACAASPQSAGV